MACSIAIQLPEQNPYYLRAPIWHFVFLLTCQLALISDLPSMLVAAVHITHAVKIQKRQEQYFQLLRQNVSRFQCCPSSDLLSQTRYPIWSYQIDIPRCEFWVHQFWICRNQSLMYRDSLEYLWLLFGVVWLEETMNVHLTDNIVPFGFIFHRQ